EKELTTKQTLYQQLEQEKNHKEAQLQALSLSTEPNSEEQAKMDQLQKELTELDKKLKLETKIKKQLQGELETKRNQIAELETKLEEKDEQLEALKKNQRELIEVEKELTQQLSRGGSTAKIHKAKEAKEKAINTKI